MALLVALGTGTAHNKSRHRMSGTNINCKSEHQSVPLIGALGR